MTDRAYPALDPAAALSPTDLVVVHQAGRLVRLPLSTLTDYIRTAASIIPATAPFRGVLLQRTANLVAPTFPLLVPWQQAVYDTDSFWSAGAPTRITIPAGVTRVRLHGSCELTTSGNAGSLAAFVWRNGSRLRYNTGPSVRNGTTGFGDNVASTDTAVISVVPGDFFELNVFRSGLTGANDVQFDRSTWFALEVVERTL